MRLLPPTSHHSTHSSSETVRCGPNPPPRHGHGNGNQINKEINNPSQPATTSTLLTNHVTRPLPSAARALLRPSRPPFHHVNRTTTPPTTRAVALTAPQSTVQRIWLLRARGVPRAVGARLPVLFSCRATPRRRACRAVGGRGCRGREAVLDGAASCCRVPAAAAVARSEAGAGRT